ncbi:molybdopterin-guanine dinucleotide biosynthesis protein B [Undibacterium sp. FT147W]|uniref:Molybdopterin-guanine dinucleotide biosynthesis protein B n=1 Tax=Undibacterium rivi TaxID=2828729 RepID=A0ABS5H3Y9_9BURK|nr:molybdopterin-guanine dinucleotide biosynthesis protein B [Undibacterium rivi]MBR7793507.1 molybdopterin-guanine dinucleotide biosynthesis protein B [Undibacterium rivi]
MAQNILGVVGWSGSGKTTLLEFLVKELCTLGHRVNVVKHSHHDIIIEPPQKDSARFRTAGAAEVLLVSPYRYVMTRELRGESEPALMDILPRLSSSDLIFVEGYKWEAIPKIEVYRPALGKPAIFPDDPHIVAVASDVAAPENLRPGLAWLDLNKTIDVLKWILAELHQKNFSTSLK